MIESRDVLSRDNIIEKIKTVVDMHIISEKEISFALEGKWGIGKTFILDRIMDYYKEKDNVILMYYNCWQNDFYDEPLFSMATQLRYVGDENRVQDQERVSDIFHDIKDILLIAYYMNNENNEKNELKAASGMASLIGTKYEKIKYNAVKCPSNISSLDTALGKARQNIRKIVKDKTMIIVIDEVDRCVPSYAIKVLERMHHLTKDINNLILIFAFDGEQLEYSVKKMFGNDTRVDYYLKKFIDFKFVLDCGEIDEGLCNLYQDYLDRFSQVINEELVSLFKATGLEMRVLIKLLDKAKMIDEMLFMENKSRHFSVLLFEVLYVVLDYRLHNFEKEVLKYTQMTWANCVKRHSEVSDFVKEKMFNFLSTKQDVFEEQLLQNGHQKNFCIDTAWNRCLIYFSLVFDDKGEKWSTGDFNLYDCYEECNNFVEWCNIIK